MSDVNRDQAIFDAIVAATSTPAGFLPVPINIDIQKFIDTFNGHRDRKLCTSLDVAQAPPDQFMDDYKRDTTNAMAARILELEAALREIDNMAPATCEVTLAHQMADIASAALQFADDKMARVDASLATQLGHSIKMNSNLSAVITKLRTALQELAFDDIKAGHADIARTALDTSTAMMKAMREK